MSTFATRYEDFLRQVNESENDFGFTIEGLIRIEPALQFLHHRWWKVQTEGFEHLPEHGPALIVGNTNSLIPWTALMLIYTLMSREIHARRLNVVCDLDWINDEQLLKVLQEIGFVPWSAANLKQLFAKGELVAMFPEGGSAVGKIGSMRNRVSEFDWTKFLPPVEAGIKIYPLAILGCDDVSPTFTELDSLIKVLTLKTLPASSLLMSLPFPFNLSSSPVPWKMQLLPICKYEVAEKREEVQESAKKQALLAEGAIQAELNRLLRVQHRVL